ncbi:MAG: HD domain-containing protein [Chlamydiales bacterium]|jgi:guanosine-3',5'-bis(diphosphate) 3'-pyrophosphohydrolase|nr:HD domain-containing protein [Chlamydiales bacterium]
MNNCAFTYFILAMMISSYADDVKPKVAICQESTQQFTKQIIQEKIEETKVLISKIVHGDEVVMTQFDLLAEELAIAYCREKGVTLHEVEQILQAMEFSTEKHRFQTRKNDRKTPYVSHCFEVAYKVMSVGEVRDLTSILASLLHDILKDTQTTVEEIEKTFGTQVAKVVDELTGDRKLSLQEKKRQETIHASYRSKPAAIVQLADTLCNTLELLNHPPKGWSRKYIDQYFQWAQTVVDRLPLVNPKLKEAVLITLNQYWETSQAASSP